MKKFSVLLAILMVLLLAVSASAQEVIFEMADPIGDAKGDGNYTHPTSGDFGDRVAEMLDLTNFRVTDLGNKVEFRLSFALEPNYVNPWGGGGLNFHRIDIYLVTGEEGGKTETFRDGAFVKFAEPWNKLIKVLDWDRSRIFTTSDDPADGDAGIGVSDDFTVKVEGKDIVITVAKSIIGEIDQSTKYYVLVGHQCEFGDDNYRAVAEVAGEWQGGGGDDTNFNPNVYDMLAETADEQYRQLGSWEIGKLAVIKPVGGKSAGAAGSTTTIIVVVVALVVIAGGVYFYMKKGKKVAA
ncbi:glucodextranase DOMON-like domain-containing protein [Anaerobranca gottschalkii]|uniref:C-terminal binding-module, SLH-like, of glucodextranase n=1 Tax=Anaerobranca gottschalkii DSM 13577 TaxID=1120990 RepID=A0A1H9ZTH5_9FIRM|nr:glucodextranase DOMON-like domain-containing protein [Anaerobranca gottschalkii]SES84128.1 C-terminal binding-module, SLH-like, of glucodextranase [Anaerobranca gottschalkii DSM 13577]